MRKMILLTLTLTAAPAFAANTAPKYEQFFLVDGKRTDSGEQAIMAAIRGSAAYKCQTVEAKLSKSGTSVGLRNVKKPRTQN